MTDGTVYWVDRFDHILSEDECDQLLGDTKEFISYEDHFMSSFLERSTNKSISIEKTLSAYYFSEEKRAVNFLLEFCKSNLKDISEIEFKIESTSNFETYIEQACERWKLEEIIKLRGDGYSASRSFRNTEHFEFLVQLALREEVNIILKANEVVIQIGWNFKMLFQFVSKKLLEEYCIKHKFYILDEFQNSIWTNFD
jgi:hypothetical protein